LPLFEKAFDKATAPYPRDPFIEILSAFEERCRADPREPGERHPAAEPDREWWVYESPSVSGVPRFMIVYEIDDARGDVNLIAMSIL
jgi:hypothetical protein